MNTILDVEEQNPAPKIPKRYRNVGKLLDEIGCWILAHRMCVNGIKIQRFWKIKYLKGNEATRDAWLKRKLPRVRYRGEMLDLQQNHFEILEDFGFNRPRPIFFWGI